jgi:hypothetical protein
VPFGRESPPDVAEGARVAGGTVADGPVSGAVVEVAGGGTVAEGVCIAAKIAVWVRFGVGKSN